jgi:hypothetical protein
MPFTVMRTGAVDGRFRHLFRRPVGAERADPPRELGEVDEGRARN